MDHESACSDVANASGHIHIESSEESAMSNVPDPIQTPTSPVQPVIKPEEDGIYQGKKVGGLAHGYGKFSY